MSRTGKLPVIIPDKVKVAVQNGTVNVEGPKGKLSQSFDSSVIIEIEDGKVLVKPGRENRHARAMHGTARSIIANMVKGVQSGYVKDLEIQGVGFRAALSGTTLTLNLGYAHDIKYTVPAGVKLTIADNTKIKIESPDKHMVGQVAAAIKQFYPVEPYKGKGVRIIGEPVRRKEGKKTA